MKSKQYLGVSSLDFPIVNSFVGLDLVEQVVEEAFAKGSEKRSKRKA